MFSFTDYLNQDNAEKLFSDIFEKKGHKEKNKFNKSIEEEDSLEKIKKKNLQSIY